MREAMSTQQMHAWLDTPAGLALLAANGGNRMAAANAMYQSAAADTAWRRERAEDRAERFPDRYACVADAMRDIPTPLGGGGAVLEGSVDAIVTAFRHADPACGVRNLGDHPQDGVPATALVGNPDGTYKQADLRPPWRRDG